MSPNTVLSSSGATFPSTGRKSYGQMITDICAYFGFDGDDEKEALAGRMIHNIIDKLNMKRLWQFNLLVASDITTSNGVTSYSVPADIWRVYSLRKTDGVDYTLDGVSQHQLDILFQSQSGITGYPFVRADFNIYRDGTFSIFPAPDGAHTLKLRYFRLIPKPSEPGGFLDMPSPYQVVPEYGAMAQMASLAGSDQVVFWKNEYNEGLQLMEHADEDSVGDEQLRLLSIEELAARSTSYLNPNARPRYLDFY